MTITNIVLDFDGTLTDPWQEIITPKGESFIDVNLRNFREKLAIAEDSFMKVYKQIEDEIKQDDTRGWEFKGHDIVPAISDPYLLNNVVQKTLFTQLKAGELDNILKGGYDREALKEIDPDAMDGFMYGNYQVSYRDDVIVYREGKEQAQKFIDTMLDLGLDITVVTNSEAEKVKKKLDTLKNTENIEVVGDAKKMLINPNYDVLPREETVQSYPRTILLQRENYHNALKTLEKEKGYTPQNTVVVGDIYEFDHALPMFLGYTGVVLGTEEHTPSYEKSMLSTHPKAAFVTKFDEAANALTKIVGGRK